MSYENGTQYYNLPQTQGTDRRDWFDTNEAFRNVDTDLHTAMQNSETTQQSLEVVNQKVTLVEGRVQVAEENVATLQGDLATTNENVATNSNAIASLQTAVTDNKQDLEDMITAYEEATATASRRYEVGDYFRYNDVLYITTVVITQGSTIVPDVNCESTNVMTRVKLLESVAPTPTESVIDDGVTSSTKTWSSSKINTQMATKCNDSKVGNLSNLDTTNKSSIVNAINEIFGMIGGGSMPELDFANKVVLTTTDYTTTKIGAIVGTVRTPDTASIIISVNGDGIITAAQGENTSVSIQYVPAGVTIALNKNNFSNNVCYFIPYK